MSTASKILGTAAALTATALVVLAGTLFAVSPGLPSELTDEAGKPIPGSLSEKVFLEINGVRQGFHRRVGVIARGRAVCRTYINITYDYPS